MRKVVSVGICIMVLLFSGFSHDTVATGEYLNVVLRDESFRKLLIKNGSIYTAEEEVYIELPTDIFEEDKVYEINIESMEKESGEIRNYNFYYQLEIP